jgi:hypothetical protein
MNQPAQIWSMPWHARLKNLADTLRAEGTDTQAATAKIVRARIAVSPAGSWLRRGRSRTMPLYLDAC